MTTRGRLLQQLVGRHVPIQSRERASQFINHDHGAGAQGIRHACVSKTKRAIECEDVIVATGHPKGNLGLARRGQEGEALLNK